MGCGGDASDTDTGTTTANLLHVARDCQPTPGNICPFAGDGYNGYNGDGLPALDAWFSFPMSATHSPYGKVIIADWNNHKLRELQDDGTLRVVMGTDFLGDGDADHLDQTPEGADGLAVNLNHPTMQQYFSDGTLLSASWHTHKLRTWDPTTGKVHVICGAGAGFTGNETESIDEALLNQPKEILIDSADNVYVLDMRNQRIRFMDFAANTLTTVAGNGTQDYCGDGGPAMDACFNFPENANPEPGGALALDEAGGLLYVADSLSHVVRVIDLNAGTIDLLAGIPGTAGLDNGDALASTFRYPSDLILDGRTLFIADSDNHVIRELDLDSLTVGTFAGTGASSCPYDGDVAVPQMCDEQHMGGDGGPASEATLYRPMGIDLTLDGDLVIADTYNHRLRIVYR
jgi:hypothetical protein